MRLLAILAAVPLILAPAADAAVPKTKHKELGFPISAGGVKIGEKAPDAIKAWGAAGTDCDPATTTSGLCNWVGSDKEAWGYIVFKNGKVQAIGISAGGSAQTGFKGAVAKWKSPKGVGLRTPIHTVAEKYPKLESTDAGFRLDSGKRSTLFRGSGGRVVEIEFGFLAF